MFYVTREDIPNPVLFIENLPEDRTESTMAYHEFLTFMPKHLENDILYSKKVWRGKVW